MTGTGETPERTALYRMYDASSKLLYVGITNHIGSRWDRHAEKQPWWPDVRRQVVDWYPSREDAEREEKLAIRTEEPKYNVRHYPQLRWAAWSGRYPHNPWIRREHVEGEFQRRMMLYDQVINLFMAIAAAHGADMERVLNNLGPEHRELLLP